MLELSSVAHETVSLEQDHHDARLAMRDPGFVREVVDRHRLIERIRLEHQRDARGLLDLRIFAAEEIGLNPSVLDAVEHRAHRRKSIAAGAAGFLIVGLDRSREVVVYNKAKILLVDA